MIKNIISNLLDKFNKRNLGEVTISLIVAILVFLALAFGIIELGTMAYKDMVVNNRLESVVKTAESKSDLFVDESASVLITYKNKFITCDENYELNCCSEDSCCSTRHCEICSLGDGICHEEKALCRFWKTLYEVAKQEDLGGVYDEFTPRFNYSSDKGDKGDEGDRKCMAKVAVLLPGFYINYNNGSTVTVHVPASEGKEARDAKVRVYDFKVDRATESVLSELKHDGVISAEVDVIKEKGLFSFYLGDNDKGFTRKMYHSGKPRIYANVPCPTERVCGVLCCAPGLKGIKCDSSGDEECCTPNSICGNICCTGTEQCLNAESSLCCPLDRICDTQCCEEGQECVEGKNGNKTCGFVTPTNTNTPIPPTNTNTPIIVVTEIVTETPVPPTNTNTPVPPTNTNTQVPPTDTNTPIPPTNTPTLLTCDIDKQCDTTCCGVDETCVNKVCVIITSTPTDTPVTPTDTPTDTPVPPTDTNTPIPPTNTNTPEPPTNTPTNTPVVPTATNTPFGGGCRCPDGYVCMDDPEGDSNPSGNNNRCCNDEEGNPGEGCCENRNYHDPQDGVNSPICCEDNQVPHYANYPDGRVVFTCESGCPEGFKTYPEVNNIFVCCPNEAPVFHGYSQFSHIPVCCAQGANFCGGTSCCPVTGSVHVTGGVYGQGGTDFQFDSDAKYCAPIKGSMIALQATGGGLTVKEAQTCCRGENDVFCGGTCCPSERCVAPVANEGERMTLRYDELEDQSRVADWSYVIGLFNHDAFVRGHKCCLTPNEIFTSGYTDNGDAIQDCCVTEDENGEVINEVITFTDENGRDVSVCCGSGNVHELDDGSLACCNGTWGEFEIVEGGHTSSASSKNTTNSSYSYTTNSDNSRYSDTYSDDGISDISVRKIYKCCEVGAPYLDENNEPQCCNGTTFFNAQSGKVACCPTNEKKTNGRQKWDLEYSDDGSSAVCCERNASGKINAGIGADGKLTCCGSDDKVFTDFHGKKHCCPSDKYYTNQGVAGCCDGTIYDFVGQQVCCTDGKKGYLDSDGNAKCCEGQYYVDNNEGKCCNGEYKMGGDGGQVCCQERFKAYLDDEMHANCCEVEGVNGETLNKVIGTKCCGINFVYDNGNKCCEDELCGTSCCPEGQTCQPNSQCGESEESQCCPYGYIAGEGADCSYENGCKLSDGENYCCLAQFLFKPHLDVGDPENVPCRMESDKPYKTCSCKPQYHGTSFDGEEQCCPVLSKKNIGRADIWSGYVCIREGNRMATTCKIGEKIGQTAFFAEYLYDHRNDAMPHPKCCVEYDSGYYGDLCCGEAFCESGN